MKKRTSPTIRTVSSSVSANTNGGDSDPSARRTFIPNALRNVMMTIWVGKPEQRRTSSAAAARSIGRTAGG